MTKLETRLHWVGIRSKLMAEDAKRRLMHKHPCLRDDTYTGNAGPLRIPPKPKCLDCGSERIG